MSLLVSDLRSDLRIAVRQLRKQPVVTVAAILMLALGIGANTAVFSVVHSVLLAPLPYPDADRLVAIFESRDDGGWNAVSGGAFLDWRDHQSRFDQSHLDALAVSEPIERNLTGEGTPSRVTGLRVSSSYLPVLGIEPALGRGLQSETAVSEPADARTVVVSHRFWRDRLGADPGAPGRTLVLDQVPHTLVGVLPPDALLEDDAEILVPVQLPEAGGDPDEWARSGHWRSVIGRLADDTSATQAETELRAVKDRLSDQYPSFKADWSVAVVPLQEVHARDARPLLFVLLGTVALVLLIACANVSSLLLARGQARLQEMAVRSALGAHRWRIVRQMLVESLLLAALGCGAGLLLAPFAVDLLGSLIVEDLPQALAPTLDGAVLAFTAGLSLACGLLFGVLPALRASRHAGRRGTRSTLEDGSRGTVSQSRRRAQTWLVAGEISLTLLLLVAAGLLLRSFASLLDVDPGFTPRGLLAFDLSFADATYPEGADRVAFLDQLTTELRALPGVVDAASTSALPLSRRGRTELARVDGAPEGSDVLVITNAVDASYFDTLEMPILRGRGLTAADEGPSAEPTVVVDQRLAERLFDDQDPVGQRLRLLGESWRIVGVVRPIRQMMLDLDPQPTVYRAQIHDPSAASVVVRSETPAAALLPIVRETVLELDPAQPIANVRTLEDAVERSLASRRATVTLLGAFAAVAVGLAALGLYGLMSFTLAQRRRELGIRAALGAGRPALRRLLYRSGLRVTAAGLVLGTAAALAGARLLESFLFQVDAHDPWVYLGAVALLLGFAILSILAPARRAARADPTITLRGA